MEKDDKQGLLFGISAKKQKEEIEIYHDEVYDDDNKPFGHQFLIIPIRSRNFFNTILMAERKKYKANALTINWKKLRENYNRNRNIVAQRWLEVLYDATHNSSFKYIKENREPLITKTPLGIKIGSVFIPSINAMSDEFWLHVEKSEDRTKKKYETLLRWGIQGCLHFFFNPDYTNYSQVLVKNFYTDSKVFGEVNLDRARIFERLEYKVRNYIKINENIKITPVMKSKIKTPEVNFEELTDIILGATCYLCGNEKKEDWKDKIIEPLKIIYSKRERGGNLRKSGHYRNFTVGYCSVDENNELNFHNWELSLDDENIQQESQKTLI
jgi:hypothetical protein